MSCILRIKVTGFWGGHTVEMSLREDINFIIGINGTGKTTLMNLVGAALTRDYETLMSIEFDEIEVIFRDGRRRPRVRVVRDADPEHPGDELAYFVQRSGSTRATRYDVGRSVRRVVRDGAQRRFYFAADEELRRVLDKLVTIVWLTVHRARLSGVEADDPHRRRHPRPLIEYKLGRTERRLARYFSALETQAKKENEAFQHAVLLGLIKSEWDPGAPIARVTADANSESNQGEVRRQAERVFSEMGVQARDYEPAIGRILDGYQRTLSELVGAEEPVALDMNALAGFLQMQRLEEVVREWERRNERLREIFRRRDLFMDLMNALYRKKRLRISSTNELEIESDGGQVIPLTKLSSGEKQLLIIFGEALLQGANEWSYLADEPELSLHIEWQSRLVSGVRDLSPNAQVLFATHSPDVVGQYGYAVQDMEALVS